MVLGQEASGVEGIGRTMPGTPRPCLLHMQSLEVSTIIEVSTLVEVSTRGQDVEPAR